MRALADTLTRWPAESLARRPLLAGVLAFLSRLVPASFFAVVCISFWVDFRETGRLTSLAWIVSEAMVVVLFVVRRPSHLISERPLDWLVAVAGSTVFLMARPADSAVAPEWLALSLQLTGLAIQATSKATLGRSFGVVAANRGIVTRGPYRLVRHPIYLGYLVTHIGFLLVDTSPRNLAVYLIGYTFQIARIVAEERVLRSDASYCGYCQQVRYRLIPGVF